MTTWRAEAIWPGETVYIICGGPSLAGFDFRRLVGKRIIAINSSVFAAPFADVLFFGDARWWAWNSKRLEREYRGTIVTSSELRVPGILALNKQTPPPAITTDRTALTVRNTSLTGAMNLAVHFGATKLVLLGADMKADGDRSHHHDPHPIRPVVGCWDRQMQELIHTVRPLEDMGVEVVNTSLDSRITWWPKRDIDEVLRD